MDEYIRGALDALIYLKYFILSSQGGREVILREVESLLAEIENNIYDRFKVRLVQC